MGEEAFGDGADNLTGIVAIIPNLGPAPAEEVRSDSAPSSAYGSRSSSTSGSPRKPAPPQLPGAIGRMTMPAERDLGESPSRDVDDEDDDMST